MKQLFKNISFNKGSSTISSAFIIIILVVILVGGILIYQIVTGDFTNDVWLKFWQYRRVIVLENLSRVDILNYNLLLRINTSELIEEGKLASDCRDIRFTDPESEKFLSYWLEGECDTEETKIWVRVPYLSSTAKKKIHFYYGNIDAVKGAVAENLPQNFVVTRAKGIKDSIFNNQSRCVRGTNEIMYCVSPFGSPANIYLFSSVNKGRDWESEKVSEGSSSPQDFPALAIDSTNNIHIVWQEAGESAGLYYRQKNGNGWGETKKIASSGKNPSLTIDMYNNVHIVYTDEKGDIYYHKNPFTLQPETELIGSGLGYPNIVADSKDGVYVAYTIENKTGAQKIAYLQKAANNWSETELIEGVYPDLAVDSQKNIHLVYQAEEKIVYQKRINSAWGEKEIVAANGFQPSIALDQGDSVYITFSVKSDPAVYYRQKIGAEWKPAKKIIADGSNPNLIWSRQPMTNEIYYNIPRQGFSLIYVSLTTESLKFYSDPYLFYQQLDFDLPIVIEEENNIDDY
ncbi:MAG: DUF2341 domain-containing protein [bacterium]